MSALLSLAFVALRGVLPLVGGFFTGGLSWVLSFLSVAWGSELGRTIIIALGCLFGGFGWGFSHEHAEKIHAVAEAVASRDADWQKEITAANTKNEQRVQEALNAARNVAPAPISRDDLIKLCKSDPSCRGAFVQDRRVQAAKRNVGAKRQPANN